jgi:elongation factor 1-gamma
LGGEEGQDVGSGRPPFGKVSAFEGADSTKIVESDAIAQYVAESGPAAGQLLGTTPAERAAIRQWISFTNGEIQVLGFR